MRRTCLIVLVAACNGGGDGVFCDERVGTYAGSITGGSPFNGTITLVLTKNSGTSTLDFKGTWTGQNGHLGEVNRTDLDCSTGSVDYDFGFSLSGPSSVTCPPGCAPGSSSGGCYCTGLTLGPFSGTMTETGGTGTFVVNSGAATSKGFALTNGTWTVTRN